MPEKHLYLRPMMEGLLKRVLDHNKKVHEAACSAFATLEEDAETKLVPYLGPILQNLMFAYGKYQAKNLLILYDAIGTLADSVGSDLNRPEHVAVLMPPLIAKWNVIADDDTSLFPMLECFTSIAQALGGGFTQFAQPVYTRCVTLIEKTLRADAGGEAPDKEFVVCSLDLISGMIEGMGSGVEPLVAASNLPLLLLACMRDPVADVRQSAYALVGDLAKACISSLAPLLSEYLPILTQQLDPDVVSVCNNASWAIGEVAIKVGGEMRPFAEAIMQRLIPIITRTEGQINKSLVENTAITIGRLGLVVPDLVAPSLETYISPWCVHGPRTRARRGARPARPALAPALSLPRTPTPTPPHRHPALTPRTPAARCVSLRSIREDVEKEHACMGLCQMVKINPRAPLNAMIPMCDTFASWTAPPAELNETFRLILVGYKGSIPAEQWATFYATFPSDLRKRLTERYGL